MFNLDQYPTESESGPERNEESNGNQSSSSRYPISTPTGIPTTPNHRLPNIGRRRVQPSLVRGGSAPGHIIQMRRQFQSSQEALTNSDAGRQPSLPLHRSHSSDSEHHPDLNVMGYIRQRRNAIYQWSPQQSNSPADFLDDRLPDSVIGSPVPPPLRSRIPSRYRPTQLEMGQKYGRRDSLPIEIEETHPKSIGHKQFNSISSNEGILPHFIPYEQTLPSNRNAGVRNAPFLKQDTVAEQLGNSHQSPHRAKSTDQPFFESSLNIETHPTPSPGTQSPPHDSIYVVRQPSPSPSPSKSTKKQLPDIEKCDHSGPRKDQPATAGYSEHYSLTDSPGLSPNVTTHRKGKRTGRVSHKSSSDDNWIKTSR
jgi:hypothetical protein